MIGGLLDKKLVLLLILCSLVGCRNKAYVKNRFSLRISDVGVFRLNGKDSCNCQRLTELKGIERYRSDTSTLYLGLQFSKTFVSDSTWKKPIIGFVKEGQDGIIKPLNAIVIQMKDHTSGVKKEISNLLEASHIEKISYLNPSLKKETFYFSKDNCVFTNSFNSIRELENRINQNHRSVSGTNLKHILFFKLPSNLEVSTDVSAEIR